MKGNTNIKMNNKKLKIVAFTAWSIIVLTLWTLHPKTFEFSDPVAYLRLAYDFPNILDWPMDDPFQHRIGLLFVHWLSYSVFGYNEIGAFLPQLGFLMIIFFLVGQYCKNWFEWLIAGLILLLLIPQSINVFPDLGASALMLASILLLDRRTDWRFGVAFSIVGFAAFLIKETAYFLAAPYFIILVVDLLKRNSSCSLSSINFFISSAITAFFLIAAYLIFYGYFFENPLGRFNTISNYGTRHLWILESNSQLLNRLFIAPIFAFLVYFGASFLVACLASIILVKERSSHQVVSIYFISGLLLFIFGTTSFTSYQPLPLMSRMFSFLVPVTAILCARSISSILRYSGDKNRKSAVIALILSLFITYNTVSTISRSFYLASQSDLHNVRITVVEFLTRNKAARLIVAEPRTAKMINIYNGFDESINAQIRACSDLINISGITEFVFFVDHEKAKFLTNAYGTETCTEDVQKLAKKVGATQQINNEKIFLAFKRD